MEIVEDCRISFKIQDSDLLKALSTILSKQAGMWYRTVRGDIKTWKRFKKAFKNQLIGEYNREDLMNDLRNRTQGEEETITNYSNNFRYIISIFNKPLSRKTVVDFIYRNLLPD